MYITSTGPLEKKRGFPGQGLAGSHANFSRYVSNTRNRLPRRTAKLISSHSIYSFSSFGNILNSHLYFAFHFHIRCGSHVDLYVKGVTHSDESTAEYYPTPQLRKGLVSLSACFGPLAHNFTAFVHSHHILECISRSSRALKTHRTAR